MRVLFPRGFNDCALGADDTRDGFLLGGVVMPAVQEENIGFRLLEFRSENLDEILRGLASIAFVQQRAGRSFGLL